MLLCKGHSHYWVAANVPSLNVQHAIKSSNIPSSQPFFSNGKLAVDIAVHVLESNGSHRTDPCYLFKAEENYSQQLKTFRYEVGTVGQEGTGMISSPLPSFPRTDKHTFYFWCPDAEEWVYIGELARPNFHSEFPCEYFAILDEHGELRIYAGQVPYWVTDDEEGLKQDGCVFFTELEMQPSEIDKERDPFCGIH